MNRMKQEAKEKRKSEALDVIYEAVVKVLPRSKMPGKGAFFTREWSPLCPLGCLLRCNEFFEVLYPVYISSAILGVPSVWVRGFIAGWDSRPLLPAYKDCLDYEAGILVARELRRRLREEGRK